MKKWTTNKRKKINTMKKKIFGWISLILGAINLIATIVYEVHVWDKNKWDIFHDDFKIWALLVLLWVAFGYFFLRWGCEEYLDLRRRKKERKKDERYKKLRDKN